MQVSHIDVTKESPCAKGTVICFSLFCGDDEGVDFTPPAADGGDDPNTDEDAALHPKKNMLWVDTLLNDAVRPVIQSKSILRHQHYNHFLLSASV